MMTDIIFEKIPSKTPDKFDRIYQVFDRIPLTDNERNLLVRTIQNDCVRTVSVYLKAGGIVTCHWYAMDTDSNTEFAVFWDDTKSYNEFVLHRDGRFTEDHRICEN